MKGLAIRPASIRDFAVVFDWAATEGWNPGLDDIAAFHTVDPAGFLMGFLEGEPVSSISVVRYGDDFGFLGFYIVRPDHRGTGAGIATWNAGMKHLEGRTVGLDGVVAQQENYRKSGFALAGRNIRHTGIPKRLALPDSGCLIRPAEASDLPALCAYDRPMFPADRSRFVANWVLPPENARRWSIAALREGEIAGYATIRECRTGYKIGPLFADATAIAHALIATLVEMTPPDAAVSLDTPEDNEDAVALARATGLAPVFETARMYRGTNPHLPLDRIFGITTFELG